MRSARRARTATARSASTRGQVRCAAIGLRRVQHRRTGVRAECPARGVADRPAPARRQRGGRRRCGRCPAGGPGRPGRRRTAAIPCPASNTNPYMDNGATADDRSSLDSAVANRSISHPTATAVAAGTALPSTVKPTSPAKSPGPVHVNLINSSIRSRTSAGTTVRCDMDESPWKASTVDRRDAEHDRALLRRGRVRGSPGSAHARSIGHRTAIRNAIAWTALRGKGGEGRDF